jgi:hypothetical protein
MISFEALFRSTCSERDKFLSRLFGIFNEAIVRIWCRQPQAEFEDLGRPTLKKQNASKPLTLDFTMRSRRSGDIFIGEMKCELEFQHYKYLTLTTAQQLDHHTKEAFQWFLSFARNPAQFSVRCGGDLISPSGAILVWGTVTERGRQAVLQETATRKISAVLSLEQMVADLQSWGSGEYEQFIALREKWCTELFSALRAGQS